MMHGTVVLIVIPSQLAIEIFDNGMSVRKRRLSVPHVFGHLLGEHRRAHHVERFLRVAVAMISNEGQPGDISLGQLHMSEFQSRVTMPNY